MAPAPARSPRRPLHAGWLLVVAAGLVAAVANYALLTRDVPDVVVAVVDRATAAGTPAEALRLRTERMAIPDPAGHLLVDPADLDDLAGTVTTTALEPGALLRRTDLREVGGAGTGAMGLPIDPARAAGGLLQVGDRVDVIAGDAEAVAVVVRHVEVLGVLAPGSGLGGSGGYALTLAVDEAQALALAAALRAGEVDVVRSPGPAGRTSSAAAGGPAGTPPEDGTTAEAATEGAAAGPAARTSRTAGSGG